MKVAILAGGRGARLADGADATPKPLTEIGGRPILWHIMKLYAAYGHREFVIATGHRANQVSRAVEEIGAAEGWAVDAVDTGPDTMTGGRVRRLANHLGEGAFMLTWSDGLADIDLDALLAFHRAHGRLATLTAVHPPSRFGHLRLESGGNRVLEFDEKPPLADEWINGAFFVLEPGAIDYVEGDSIQWEREPLARLAADGELMAWRHESFWQCMDTRHDVERLQALWREGRAPWATWR